ncbi:hypothetical protein CRG98_011681 [Punica granatum]|uniref:Reverse transcriptase Ty1/copia-type domain-containing protein n=1 Tax=Punica granatum TaxID=22663 RepID=A0A2I0KHT9_PUNGR|nr:hypothetical protein CRG98_011681 [Punica granatum]
MPCKMSPQKAAVHEQAVLSWAANNRSASSGAVLHEPLERAQLFVPVSVTEQGSPKQARDKETPAPSVSQPPDVLSDAPDSSLHSSPQHTAPVLESESETESELLIVPVYMEQPPGFTDPAHPNYVCRLNRALYGLRQMQRLIDDLARVFSLKDLGPLHYFPGVGVSWSSEEIYLFHRQYAIDILTRASLEHCKPISTPMTMKQPTLKNGDCLYHDPSHFRSLVGAFQYLTLTAPDLALAVNVVCQHMHALTLLHFQMLK